MSNHGEYAPKCRYCKQCGHLIKDCPTRPPRRQTFGGGRVLYAKETPSPPSPQQLLSEMFWPSLTPHFESNTVKPQSVWTSGNILETIKDNPDK